MELPKTKTKAALAIGGGAAALTAVTMIFVWPALISPEPPLEKAGDDGLRIRLVEPPKARIASAGPLDVGMSGAAAAMVRAGEGLMPRAPVAAPPPPRPRAAPVQVARGDEADEADEVSAPPEDVDDRWEREALRRDRFEQAERRREEQEALAREAQDEREAWEREARERRQWEARRERDRRYDRYGPPPE